MILPSSLYQTLAYLFVTKAWQLTSIYSEHFAHWISPVKHKPENYTFAEKYSIMLHLHVVFTHSKNVQILYLTCTSTTCIESQQPLIFFDPSPAFLINTTPAKPWSKSHKYTEDTPPSKYLQYQNGYLLKWTLVRHCTNIYLFGIVQDHINFHSKNSMKN